MYDFRNVHSDYICPECGGLIYVESKTGKEICINNKCCNFPEGLSFSSITPEKDPRLFKELRKLHEELLLEIASNCDRMSLTKYLYSKRMKLIDTLFSSGIMSSISDLITLNEFLLILNNLTVIGNISDNNYFESLYDRMKKALEQLNFIEDVQNFRYLVSIQAGMSAYRLKYLTAINDVYKSYGIISSESLPELSDIFPFIEIQESVTDDVDAKPENDMADFLEQLWLFMLAMKYVFSLHYRISKQYKYKVQSVDMAFLFSILHSIKGEDILTVSLDNFRKHYEKNKQGYEEYSKDNNKEYSLRPLNAIFSEYALSTENVPIMPIVNDYIIIDRKTLLFFILFLFGLDESTESEFKSGQERIIRKREKSGQYFEQQIRNKMKELGYFGPDEPVIEKYEYDILKLHEEKKLIILGDAKFRDISPSSISGLTLIDQELLEPNQGLIAESEKEMLRLEYFLSNIEKFRKYLQPQSDWKEYKIEAYLITKHTPLIDRYKDVKIFPYKAFIMGKI